MSILLREFCYAKHRREDNVMAHPGAMRGYVRLVTFLPSMWRDLFKGLVVKLTFMSILLREFCDAKHRRG